MVSILNKYKVLEFDININIFFLKFNNFSTLTRQFLVVKILWKLYSDPTSILRIF